METASYDTIPGVMQDSSTGIPTAVWDGSSVAPFQNSFQPSSDGSNWSYVGATPGFFGASATYAPVAQSSFITPFAALSLNNNNGVTFQPAAVLNAVNFGEYISALSRDLIS